MPRKAQPSGSKDTVLAPHSLDEVPHKKHNPATYERNMDVLLPPVGTAAFADEAWRFGTNVKSELQQSQQLHRQAKQVCQHTSLLGVSIAKLGHVFRAVGKPAASQAGILMCSNCCDVSAHKADTLNLQAMAHTSAGASEPEEG